MQGWKEITDFVLRYDYCCGCGVCAGVCPQNALEMRFNEYGEYRPYLTGGCVDCGLCSSVCPFVRDNPDEDEVAKEEFGQLSGARHTPETGYYVSTYVGYAPDASLRWNSASGGMVTWILERLLSDKEIDYAVCVGSHSDSSALFKFKVCGSCDDIRACSKSCYYPVEASEVIRHVLRTPGRYAITAMPCLCKAIRLAQSRDRRLRDRIRYIFGIVCAGHTVSRSFVEYCCGLIGGNCHQLEKVAFRVKDKSRPASDFGFRFFLKRDLDQVEVRDLFFSEGPARAWGLRFFTPESCNWCDDIMAETADIAFMDAWLAPYAKDCSGTNLMIIRHKSLENWLRSEKHSASSIRSIDVEDVIRSQWRGLRIKRNLVRLQAKDAVDPPRKRIHLCSKLKYGEISEGRMLRCLLTLSRRTKAYWRDAAGDCAVFVQRLQPLDECFREANLQHERARHVNHLVRGVQSWVRWMKTR